MSTTPNAGAAQSDRELLLQAVWDIAQINKTMQEHMQQHLRLEHEARRLEREAKLSVRWTVAAAIAATGSAAAVLGILLRAFGV